MIFFSTSDFWFLCWSVNKNRYECSQTSNVFHNSFTNLLTVWFVSGDQSRIRFLIQENGVFVDWAYGFLQRHDHIPGGKNAWMDCNFAHLYKLILETQKLKLGVFDDLESDNPKVRSVFEEFVNPKKVLESREFTKEKTNSSELMEADDDCHRFESEQADSDVGNKQFSSTHFPSDFKNDLEEDKEDIIVKEELLMGEETTENKEKEQQFDDNSYWKTMMTYSNKQIEQFIVKKEEKE